MTISSQLYLVFRAIHEPYYICLMPENSYPGHDKRHRYDLNAVGRTEILRIKGPARNVACDGHEQVEGYIDH